MRGVDAISEILKREGTEFLSVFPAQPMVDGAAKVGIKPIICRQERVGMGIADGFSRTANGKRLGVFSMQQGPGTENAFGAVAQAYADNVPLLLLPGGEPENRRGIHPFFSAVDNFQQVTKWMAYVSEADRVPELMRRAFYQLRSGRPGPVLLEVTRDVWDSELSGELDYTPVNGNRTSPDPQDVKDAADTLLKANNLVIHAGQGVMYAEATDELEALAELLQAPVMTTLAGKSGFPENHPLALGASSVSTTKAIVHFLAKADVVFGIGCSFTRTNIGRIIPPGKVMVHSTNDPLDVNKDYKADQAIIGDAKLVLQALIGEIKERTNGVGNRNDTETAAEVQAVKKEWRDEWMPQLKSNEVPINQYRIIWDLMHNVDRSSLILTHDAGSPRDQTVPMWEATVPRSYMGWGKSTQLGYGLGIIMGAKLAEPDKLCINIMGDAAIGMVGMDIETAVRNKIGILTIVFNNGAMAIEKSSMPFAIEQYGSFYVGGDYRGVAEALGGYGARVEKPDEFVPALKQAIEVTKTGRPALIECITKEGYDFSKYP
jgi:acetolactate synthase-1/2/3 large subunit